MPSKLEKKDFPKEQCLASILMECFVEDKNNLKVTAREIIVRFKDEIENFNWSAAREILKHLNLQMNYFRLHHNEVIAENLFCRVMKIIKDEYFALATEELQGKTSAELNNCDFDDETEETLMYMTNLPDLKGAIREALEELLEEIDYSNNTMANQVNEFICENDVIMTLGYNTTILKILKHASKTKKITVVLAEGVRPKDGAQMAKSLGEAGIETTFIHDETINVFLPEVNLVLIGAISIHVVNGIKAENGNLILAMNAKVLKVPVIACCALHAISANDEFIPHLDQLSLNTPDVLFNTGKVPHEKMKFIQLRTHHHEYVDIEYVNNVIFNSRTADPLDISRIHRELYYLEEAVQPSLMG